MTINPDLTIAHADTHPSGVIDVSDRFELSAEPMPDLATGLDRVGPTAPAGLARRLGERGMVTAEWAIGVVVAVSLAGLLLMFIVKGPAKEVLTGIILKIISTVSAWGLKG